MALPSIIAVIPPTVCLVLAVYIFFQGWKDSGIEIFITLLAVLSVYGIIQVIIQNQTQTNTIAELTRLRTSLWGLITPLSYHTIIALMKERRKKWMFVLGYLYILGIAIILLSITGSTIYKEYNTTSLGWNALPDTGSWFFWALHLYLVTGVVVLIITLFEIRQTTQNFRIRKLTHTIVINFIWGGTFTILPYFILSLYKLPAEIFLAYAGIIAVFIIVSTIQKYQPKKFSSENLLSNLQPFMQADAVMITPEKIISWLSCDKLLFSSFSRKDLVGFELKKLFADSTLIDEELNKIKINHDYSASFETECNTLNGNTVSQIIRISGLRNEYNDIIAYLVVFVKSILNGNTMEYLQKSYGLSEREKEVAALLINDFSNMQICDRLFISLNTVKTHTKNIYQKTNTSNRTEFKNLCRSLSK